MKLYEYWRSSAAFRVRIALGLKEASYSSIPVDLRAGEQRENYLETNPAGLVPALQTEESYLSQSIAIIEYLEEQFSTPALLPKSPLAKAQVRALAFDIACDIHPLNNLRVLQSLRSEFDANEDQVTHWYHHWLQLGFDSLEKRASEYASGEWLYHNELSMADVILVPQIYNALKFNFDMKDYPRLMRIYNSALTHSAFKLALPENNEPV